MESLTMVLEHSAELTATARRVRRTYLGSYMPFAGIRYYAVFTDLDIARGRAKIGPVGWRVATPAPDGEPAKVLLAA